MYSYRANFSATCVCVLSIIFHAAKNTIHHHKDQTTTSARSASAHARPPHSKANTLFSWYNNSSSCRKRAFGSHGRVVPLANEIPCGRTRIGGWKSASVPLSADARLTRSTCSTRCPWCNNCCLSRTLVFPHGVYEGRLATRSFAGTIRKESRMTTSGGRYFPLG